MIALTGATGFLGSHIAKQLAASGIPFRCLIRANSRNLKNLEGISASQTTADFSSVSSLSKALDGCTTVIHALGLINGSEEELRRVNVEFTRNLVLAATEKKIQKFICISSVAAGMRHGQYGVTKYEGEQTVVKSGMPYLVFRPAWIFGPNDQNNTAVMMRVLKRWPLVPLFGGGTFKLQPVFVDDVASLVLQGIHFSRLNSVYNVAGREQISLKRILEIFSKHMKVKRVFVPIPLKPLQAVMRVYLKINPNTRLPAKQILELDKHEAFDISETVRDFGFNPLTFEQGAERMFARCAE